MIIISKIVRRECRGAMYGIYSTFGAIGGLSGITLGKFSRRLIGFGSLYLLEMILIIVIICFILGSKLYQDK
jgi:nitrate/nitrite transporter NarK